jgi:hypothetical protein
MLNYASCVQKNSNPDIKFTSRLSNETAADRGAGQHAQSPLRDIVSFSLYDRVMQPGIFTLDIGGKPVLTFEAKNLREAWELCHERWLREDVAQLRSNGIPLWDGSATLRSRSSIEAEREVYREAAKGVESPGDGMILAYLVELDPESV